MARPSSETRPLYDRVTDAIIADLDRGIRPWMKPWNAGPLAGSVSRPLRHAGEPYRGINILLLWAEAAACGYTTSTWMTFRQALELGGHVRKGEHGATVVYANRVEQIDGLPERFLEPPPKLTPDQRIDLAETFFAKTGAVIRHGGAEAYFAFGSDHVQMPPFECFDDPEAYYATLAHECVHWTGHPRRLDRDLARLSAGCDGYAQEELVAELGSAFLCADLGLSLEPRDDHAPYIAVWLDMLGHDRRAIFAAAAKAQQACDFLHARGSST
ncbi:MAG TPA: zincin-like metallopeptidase domain-containing protein [Phenylobacterium sp.]|nr:zincin-like metallopeptidase domain-containing protein [Phenylobacterium sp.]